MREFKKYLDPRTLSRISDLELRARRVVEGYLAGLHRSPYHGWSVEFAEHRPYSPGDELRHIDWKLWARSDRFFVKLYEEETNVRAQFLVDASASMAYASGGTAKYDYGCTLAASLAYLLLTQRDAVGLTLFDEELRAELPPAANPGRLRSFCRLLERAEPGGETNLGSLLHRVAAGLSRRGIVVLVSDLLGPVDDLHSALHRLRYDGHAVIVAHVVDPAEAEFPFDGNVRFEGLEGGVELETGAGQIREAYREAFRRFTDSVQRACAELEADYMFADTQREPGATLFRFLSARAGKR